MTIFGKPTRVKRGDTLKVNPGVVHGARVIGDESARVVEIIL